MGEVRQEAELLQAQAVILSEEQRDHAIAVVGNHQVRQPIAVEVARQGRDGGQTPLVMLIAVVSGAVKLEKKVKLFEPALTETRSSPAGRRSCRRRPLGRNAGVEHERVSHRRRTARRGLEVRRRVGLAVGDYRAGP